MADPFRLNVSGGHRLFPRRLPWLSFVMVGASPCPYLVAVHDGDDEEEKKKSTASSQWAQYDWFTEHGRADFLFLVVAHTWRGSGAWSLFGGGDGLCCFCSLFSDQSGYFAKFQLDAFVKRPTGVNAAVTIFVERQQR